VHGMTRVSSVNQPQNDRKLVIFCKRPARIELFRDEIFGSRRITPRLTGRQIPSVDLTSQARGVCPPPNDTSIQCKCTVVAAGMHGGAGVSFVLLIRREGAGFVLKCMFCTLCILLLYMFRMVLLRLLTLGSCRAYIDFLSLFAYSFVIYQ
jgi:hypothetical protein